MDQYNILILDDQEDATALQNKLQSAGFDHIDTFADPAEAMVKFRNKKYHILLADMDLQTMDGIEILKKAKHYDPMTQVIMMTGNGTIDRALTCLELGANDYVLKPFKNEDYIVEVVADAINKLERWKDAIKGAVLQQSEISISDTKT